MRVTVRRRSRHRGLGTAPTIEGRDFLSKRLAEGRWRLSRSSAGGGQVQRAVQWDASLRWQFTQDRNVRRHGPRRTATHLIISCGPALLSFMPPLRSKRRHLRRGHDLR